MLDTSAVIGWLERRDESAAQAISTAKEIPVVHIVTLGELHDGVERARRGSNVEVLASRVATLRFVVSELSVADPLGADDAALFGVVSSVIGRGLSHNDKWILARVVIAEHLLVTQDAGLHTAAMSPELALALEPLGRRPPHAVLCG